MIDKRVWSRAFRVVVVFGTVSALSGVSGGCGNSGGEISAPRTSGVTASTTPAPKAEGYVTPKPTPKPKGKAQAPRAARAGSIE